MDLFLLTNCQNDRVHVSTSVLEPESKYENVVDTLVCSCIWKNHLDNHFLINQYRLIVGNYWGKHNPLLNIPNKTYIQFPKIRN